MSREETGHGSDPTWLTEARIDTVIHLYPATSWYQAGVGVEGCSIVPSWTLLYPHYLLGSLLFRLLLSDLLQAELIVPIIR